MTLALLLLLAVGAMFLAAKRSHQENRLMAEMQLNGRLALQALSHDLAMAGFLGGLTDQVTLDGVYAGCDPKTGGSNPRMPLAFHNNAGATGGLTGSCLADQNVATVTDLDGTAHGTDVVIVHRTAGKWTFRYEQNKNNHPPGLRSDTIYLRTNRTTGTLCINGNNSHPCTPTSVSYGWPTTFWEYQTFAYFIKAGDGIPTLCRRYLAVDPTKHTTSWQTECVADGVVDLQISFGVDTNGDGIANRYLTTPDASQLANAVSARVQVLMRSPRPNPRHTNDNCYTLQASAANPEQDCFDDHYYRRVMQTTVLLRNLR